MYKSTEKPEDLAFQAQQRRKYFFLQELDINFDTHPKILVIIFWNFTMF